MHDGHMLQYRCRFLSAATLEVVNSVTVPYLGLYSTQSGGAT